MKTIWKETINPNSQQNKPHPILIQYKCRPISVGVQGDDPVLWFEVDPTDSIGSTWIWCVGTGYGAVPEGKEYFATLQHNGYVWHFYR